MKSTTCEAELLRPAKPGEDDTWTFLILPQEASGVLPRRGRTTVEGTFNGHPFQATLEPDGQRSHWLKVKQALSDAAGVAPGDTVTLKIKPVIKEPEPAVPADLRDAIVASPAAKATWKATSTIARMDWIHWVTSAKKAETRQRRVKNACEMLASGKRKVCCFDPSGFYSKSFRAPEAAAS